MASITKKDKSVTVEFIKTTLPGIADIKEETFQKITHLAYQVSGKSLRVISEETGIGLASVKRSLLPAPAGEKEWYPSGCTIPDYCEVLENTLMIEWQAAQLGYQLVKVSANATEADITVGIGNVTARAGEVLLTHASAMVDEILTLEELVEHEQKLCELAGSVNQAIEAVRKRRLASQKKD
jgi:hypothetical protein